VSRTVSAAARQAVNAQNTDEVFLLLLSLDHDELAEPVRVVNNTENITSRGNLFVAYPFEVNLPDEDPDQLARVQLRIDNVDRVIIDSLRAITDPVTVSLEVIMASSPDTVEAGPFSMSLVSASYDTLLVTGDLVFEDVLNEPFPGGTYIPSDYPGLF
jgi:hypothetical protein